MEKRKGIYQILCPFYHEDGDMYDIFLEPGAPGEVRICDHGLTLMRLSYTYELDTPKKEEVFNRILKEHGIQNEDGNLFIEAPQQYALEAFFRFTQAISKITNLSLFKREVVRAMFYEDLRSFIQNSFASFHPEEKYLPLKDREDLEVDFYFPSAKRPIYLFGIRDNPKARLSAICCLEYLRRGLFFRSIAVHEDFESLSSRDRRITTSAMDKQFVDLEDFQQNGPSYIEREIA